MITLKNDYGYTDNLKITGFKCTLSLQLRTCTGSHFLNCETPHIFNLIQKKKGTA